MAMFTPNTGDAHDVTPMSIQESQLQQALWNNHSWLRDYSPRAVRDLVAARNKRISLLMQEGITHP